MNGGERRLVAIMVLVMAGWVSSPWHGISNTIVAMAGLSAILLTRVLSWEDLLAEHKAWDALIWFAPVLMMADALQETGVIKILSGALFSRMQGWPWMLSLIVLVVSYLYLHYGFASMTAHITALYPGFLAAALAAGVHPMLAVLTLAYFSNLDAGITHYGTGSAQGIFRRRLCFPGNMVEAGFFDFGRQSVYLARCGVGVVEAFGVVVKAAGPRKFSLRTRQR